jgi:hypothetical protein
VLEEINTANFERSVEISCERAPRRRQVASSWRRMLELNARHQAEAATREQPTLAQNEESH